MKNLVYFTFITLFLFTSCEQEPVNVSLKKSNLLEKTRIDAAVYYNSLDVNDFLNEYIDIFGNDVQVFVSEEEANALLDKWSKMDYLTLRQEYKERNFQNPLVEASIKWDSLYTVMEEKYKSNVMQYFVEQMLTQFPELVHQYTTILSNDNTIQKYIEPISDGWDIQSLTNSKGIVIIDKVVYQYKDDLLLTMPIDQYVDYMTSITSLEETDYVLSSINKSDVSTYAVVGQYTQTHFENEVVNQPPLVGNGKMILTLGIEGKWAWFNQTNHRGTVRIRNYRYENGQWVATKMQTSAWVRFYTTASYMNGAFCYFNWQQANSINDNIKDKVYKKIILASTTNHYKLPVTIYNVYVNAKNEGGAQIKYGLSN